MSRLSRDTSHLDITLSQNGSKIQTQSQNLVNQLGQQLVVLHGSEVGSEVGSKVRTKVGSSVESEVESKVAPARSVLKR